MTHYNKRRFLPTHIYEATSGKPVAVILRQSRTAEALTRPLTKLGIGDSLRR